MYVCLVRFSEVSVCVWLAVIPVCILSHEGTYVRVDLCGFSVTFTFCAFFFWLTLVMCVIFHLCAFRLRSVLLVCGSLTSYIIILLIRYYGFAFCHFFFNLLCFLVVSLCVCVYVCPEVSMCVWLAVIPVCVLNHQGTYVKVDFCAFSVIFTFCAFFFRLILVICAVFHLCAFLCGLVLLVCGSLPSFTIG